MAKPPKKIQKHPQSHLLEHTPDDLRWATPDIVALYRAKRLKCKTIADLGCGIGFQAFAFAKHCQKVYAVEINKEKIERAEKNAALLNIKNIEFIHGDILNQNVIQKLKKVEIIFCDPERLPEEEQRSLATIKPDIQELLNAYQSITNKIAIEFPPQIQTIPFECEREYLSLNGKLNRLTLYFNDLQQCQRSVVTLPGGERLQNSSTKVVLPLAGEPEAYLYEIDPAIVKSNLLPELLNTTKTHLLEKGKITLATSTKKINSPFFCHSYRLLAQCSDDETDLLNALKQHHAKKVTIRKSIDPQEYWNYRTKLEAKLNGTKTISLFQYKEKLLLAENLDL